MNSNEKFVFRLALMGSLFGLSIYFMSDNKAMVYAAIPTSIVTGAFGYLGTRNDRNNS